MTLRDAMRRDAARITSLNDFGEVVTVYLPHRAGIRVRAIVNRQRLEQVVGESMLAVRGADVFVPAGFGIEAWPNGTEVELPVKLGEGPSRCRSVDVLTEDEGGWLVRVEP